MHVIIISCIYPEFRESNILGLNPNFLASGVGNDVRLLVVGWNSSSSFANLTLSLFVILNNWIALLGIGLALICEMRRNIEELRPDIAENVS